MIRVTKIIVSSTGLVHSNEATIKDIVVDLLDSGGELKRGDVLVSRDDQGNDNSWLYLRSNYIRMSSGAMLREIVVEDI